MSTAPRLELEELVDAPKETLEVEYKSWLNLSDNAARADLARHIAALANHGGGRIVFGIANDMTYAGPNPNPIPAIDHDCIAAVVKKYLEPPFQCDVELVRSKAGNEHPVVTVPPHGVAPICAKANGPEVNGKVSGIVQGTYYVRKPGPESAPILAGSEWSPLIRRCAIHDRSAILGAIESVLKARLSTAQPSADELKTWHQAARATFLRDLEAVKNHPLVYEKAHIQLSYRIVTNDDEGLQGAELVDALRQVNSEARDLVQTGWSMFYIFDRQGIQPVWVVDPGSGEGDQDFLECSMLRDPFISWNGCDLWRVTRTGKATLVREYWEDDSEWCKSRGVEPGSGFDPNLMLRSLAELVRHARGMAERYSSASDVEFRAEWHGLRGRVLRSERGGYWSPRPPVVDDHRVSNGRWALPALNAEWAEIVSHLASPVGRLFGIDQFVAPDVVVQRSKSWNNLANGSGLV